MGVKGAGSVTSKRGNGVLPGSIVFWNTANVAYSNTFINENSGTTVKGAGGVSF